MVGEVGMDEGRIFLKVDEYMERQNQLGSFIDFFFFKL